MTRKKGPTASKRISKWHWNAVQIAAGCIWMFTFSGICKMDPNAFTYVKKKKKKIYIYIYISKTLLDALYCVSVKVLEKTVIKCSTSLVIVECVSTAGFCMYVWETQRKYIEMFCFYFLKSYGNKQKIIKIF